MLFINKVLQLQHWAEKEKRERERKITYKKHISIEQCWPVCWPHTRVYPWWQHGIFLQNWLLHTKLYGSKMKHPRETETANNIHGILAVIGGKFNSINKKETYLEKKSNRNKAKWKSKQNKSMSAMECERVPLTTATVALPWASPATCRLHKL